ncbi:hypothetical protein COU49_02900 [Candidatus Nomurabacteria bacterium CG10_big_fil_rev_8_21_14_0_10_35_16]|uniref:DNA polymerase III subunit delta n=1 Tax=Candidatus Nomurabacteria bacterium CG10_big_fil_rev_8_21_14_0_10_35_16 TaxID=1974731 RepID=A0A2H0TAQ3_9BACT|nr:MAG: hypothetical protein COU49_02900 [Candidatus Nomurabacteria bacterium CG10_big_fil_rev_8_21_14_0_10_35_16]
MISQHLNKTNLHHAYLIEGEKKEIEKELIQFIEELGIATKANSDFSHISVDSFKIDNARNLKAFSVEKSISKNRRIFLITANNFLLEAQNSLLKILEEPIANTHFFILVPNMNILLPTFISRFYVITSKQPWNDNNVEKFISMSLPLRLNFIKELLTEPEKGDTEEGLIDSSRAKSLRFLNSLEQVLEKKLLEYPVPTYFEHLFKVRKYLSQPGSSAKSLMESVAIITPIF